MKVAGGSHWLGLLLILFGNLPECAASSSPASRDPPAGSNSLAGRDYSPVSRWDSLSGSEYLLTGGQYSTPGRQ